MITLQIQDRKAFMGNLLTLDTFHYFLLREATIKTAVTYTIDGTLHTEFYDTAQQEQLKSTSRTYSYWKELQKQCYEMIKGSRTPLYFKIVFLMPAKWVQDFLSTLHLDLTSDEVNGLFINLQYQKGTLLCTTGTSLKTFTLDKTLEHAWEDYILQLFKSLNIPVEKL